MVATFVGKTSHVATIALEDRRTVNREWYTTVCLPQVIAELRKSNSKRRIILHHDNASSHSARQTTEYLKEGKVEILDHPPYSPDLSPNDFFTFPKIKKSLRGQRFQFGKEAVDAFKSPEHWGCSKWNSVWNKCYNN
ncbi:unnamed protein product [Euphydryas editha]|uniref:Tc1-like transposase DDE domain-containing protein n=1 Tax=Euphydryas editha TaxID=104508 RepID=A0AAU9TPR1_EUPED|nr:unnamed protein product [Euphydryas editha]